MARLEMALTVPEYGFNWGPPGSGKLFTIPQNFRPATVGYYSVFDYTYAITGGTGGNTLVDNFSRTVAPGGWGTAFTGQAWTVSGGPATDYSVAPGVGGEISLTVPLNGTNHDTYITAGTTTADWDVTALTWIASGGTPVAGAYVSSLLARGDGTANNVYIGRLRWNTDNSLDLIINKTVVGSETTIGSLIGIGTYVTGAAYWIRFTVAGSTLSLKTWLNGTTEPSTYQLVLSDTSLTTGAYVGTRTVKSVANTNATPILAYDNFSVGNVFTDSLRAVFFAPQRFGESWLVERITVNDTSTGQVPAAYIFRGTVRPDSAFNLASITYPHQVPQLLATSQVIDSTPNGTNDVDDLTSPIGLSSGEWFCVIFAGAQAPGPNDVMTSTVFVGGQTNR